MSEQSDVGMIEHSLRWKMRRAYQLAGNLCFVWDDDGYVGSVRDTTDLFGLDDSDMLWAWSEGGMHQYYDKRASGRCSIQSMIDFDVGAFEEETDEAIAKCIELHAQIELPLPDEFPEEDETETTS